jgi:hypothetical protein
MNMQPKFFFRKEEEGDHPKVWGYTGLQNPIDFSNCRKLNVLYLSRLKQPSHFWAISYLT